MTSKTPPPPLPGTCLVIGGNRGLGLEIVRHLKERRSDVMATTRKTNDALEVTKYTFRVFLPSSDPSNRIDRRKPFRVAP